MVSPVEKSIPTSNRFSALNGLHMEEQYEDPPFDSNHDPGPSRKQLAPRSLSDVQSVDCSATATETPTGPQIHQLTASATRLIKLHGTVNRRAAVILVDSGATRNFINTAFVEKHSLPTT